MTPMLAQDIIRIQRDGGTLTPEMIGNFVDGLVSGAWSDSQAAALAMAIVWRGLPTAQTVALTQAMLHSGQVLDWSGAHLHGPILDKHSTGGVGDKVSLLLAPIVAACGGVVPMISGRGLGHTGGTLDKLEALPGYDINPDRPQLLACLQSAGCAIVGASADLAPADRRLYSIRDTTATVESVALITASILSKKLAAGLQGLVLDVKVGSGAFAESPALAHELAASLVQVARGAGLPAVALVTDMFQVLGRTAGNALEVQEAIDCLTGLNPESRLIELTLELSAYLLHLGGLAHTLADARAQAARALSSGAAAERFARMVAALGGPRDVLQNAQLPQAPLQRAVLAPRAGFVAAIDVRALGQAVVALGGGRLRTGEGIDPRVGLSGVLALGVAVQAGTVLARVHAADDDQARAGVRAVGAAFTIADEAPAAMPLVHGLIEA